MSRRKRPGWLTSCVWVLVPLLNRGYETGFIIAFVHLLVLVPSLCLLYRFLVSKYFFPRY